MIGWTPCCCGTIGVIGINCGVLGGIAWTVSKGCGAIGDGVGTGKGAWVKGGILCEGALAYLVITLGALLAIEDDIGTCV